MARFLPFKSLLPSKDHINTFTAKSSDFTSQKAISDYMKVNKNSYLFVNKMHMSYEGHPQNPENYFPFSAKYISEKIQEQVLIEEQSEGYYVYQQIDTKNKLDFIGIIGLSDVLDVNKDLIKKHELTRQSREEYLLGHIRDTKVQGEPILMSYDSNAIIQNAIKETVSESPMFSFTSPDKKIHHVWKISNTNTINVLQIEMDKIVFYIADGHHRCAALERFYKRYPQKGNNLLLTYLIAKDQIKIESFYRLISKLNKFDEDKCIEQLKINFEIEILDKITPIKSVASKTIGWNSKNFKLLLTPKAHILKPDHVVENLDVSIIENYILKPILNILDSRTDHRINFLSYREMSKKVWKEIETDETQVILTLAPISFEDIKQVADKQLYMPPKSTYVEPKLRSGMLMYLNN